MNKDIDKIYHTVQAKDADEAMEKSPYFIGQQCEIAEIHASANSDGTFHVDARIRLVEKKPNAEQTDK